MSELFNKYTPEYVRRSGTESAFVGFCARGVETTLSELELEYPRWVFHSAEHTRAVTARVLYLGSLLAPPSSDVLSHTDVAFTALEASVHDKVKTFNRRESFCDKVRVITQESTTCVDSDGNGAFTDEENSALYGLRMMERLNQHSVREIGREVFHEGYRNAMREDILATIPHYDQVLATVVQPNLNYQSSLRAHLLATADLNGAGFSARLPNEGRTCAEIAKRDTYTLFFEYNPTVYSHLLIEHAWSSPKFLCHVAHSYEEWVTSQIKFLEGRKSNFALQMNMLPNPVKNVFEDVVDFDPAIRAITEYRNELEVMDVSEQIDHLRSIANSFIRRIREGVHNL